MLFSKKANYGIMALLYLHRNRQKKRFYRAQEIAKDLGLKASYLTKTLQDLARAGYIASMTGPEGGFALPPASDQTTLLQIYEALDGEVLGQCAMGWEACTTGAACPLHESTAAYKKHVSKILASTSIADAARPRGWPSVLTEKKK